MTVLSRPVATRLARAVGARRQYLCSVPAVQVKKRDGTYASEFVRQLEKRIESEK